MFNDAPLIHDVDLICILNGAEAVGDYDGSAVTKEFCERSLDEFFCFIINRGGWFFLG